MPTSVIQTSCDEKGDQKPGKQLVAYLPHKVLLGLALWCVWGVGPAGPRQTEQTLARDPVKNKITWQQRFSTNRFAVTLILPALFSSGGRAGFEINKQQNVAFNY